MKNRSAKKGFTLVEVILSFAILGILVITFMHVLSGGYINIINMGSRSKAMAKAQEIIDKAEYSTLANYGSNYGLMLSTPYDAGVDNNGRYCIRSSAVVIPELDVTMNEKSYDVVTVLVFYQGGRQYVTLSLIDE